MSSQSENTSSYTYENVLEEATNYFNGDTLAANVWINKYALKDSDGNIFEQNPNDMHKRLAKEIARIEKKYPNPLSKTEIYELFKDFKYVIPQGGPMAGIGNDHQVVSLSNCFVIGQEGEADSYGAILKTDEEQVQLMKRRGGVGHDLSHIRPQKSPVKNSALTSTGIVPFMERYSNSTREVAQDGRRGALMLSVSIKHPDSEGFIDAKLEAGKVTGANISVKMTDEFMQAVEKGKPFTQQYPIDSKKPTHVKVHKTVATEAYRSSVQMAKERGAFPIFEYKREKENPFIKRIEKADPTIIKDMKKHGRRNIALLTIAPTGSVSICTQTTSGIEPAFLITYKRRRKINPNDKNTKIDFIDEVGDAWQEYTVFHPKFKIWLEANGYNPEEVSTYDDKELQKIVKKTPYYKATANDVDWVSKVKLQGAVQKWVDHSISVTVNVPTDISEEKVGEIYHTAWKSGCKGMTIYRDGSRSGVLIKKDEKKKEANNDELQEVIAPTRPKVLEAEVIRFQNDYEKWIAVIGLLKGKPYEIFTGKAEEFYLPTWVEKGWVVKNKNGDNLPRYDFEFTDKDGYKTTVEGLSRSFNKEFWNYAKLISGVLRQGMPMVNVLDLVAGLNLNSSHINTWKNGVQRALKKFIPNGTKADGVNCPNCKGEGTVIYQEGCLVCSACGYSKCG